MHNEELKILSSNNAMDFIKELQNNKGIFWNDEDIKQLIDFMVIYLEKHNFHENRQFLDHIFSSLPTNITPLIMDILPGNVTPELTRKFIIYLLRTNRPIFQINGLKMILSLKSDQFVPYIVPLIFSSHKPLQQQAIRTILLFPGNVEEILAQSMQNRSLKKKEIVFKVLQKINPSNLKIAEKLLQSGDFMKRIEGITILGDTCNRKWIEKLTPFLKDRDLSVRKAAILNIDKLGGRKANKILRDQLEIESYQPLKQILKNKLNLL
ncbi:MAG: HEAT repeat domain-containing protein [Promethearchaeota archaeon]